MSAPETALPAAAAPISEKPKSKKTRKPIVIMEEEEYEASQAAAAAAAPPASSTAVARKARMAQPSEPQSDKERMQYFYAKRVKAKPAQRSFFQYTPEGDLRIEGDAKIADQTIPLRPFTSLRPDELQRIEGERQAALEAKETEYTAALSQLREVLQQYKQGTAAAKDVVTANEALRAVNLERLLLAYPERWTNQVENPERRRILLDEPQETRKMGYDVYLYKRLDLSRQDILGHYRDTTDAALPEQGGGSYQQPLFIDNPESEETGFFHPANEHEFVVHETRYALPLQAYEGEHFASLGDETMRGQLLKTRSARTVRNLVSKDLRRPTQPLELWTRVLEAYFEQVPDMKTKLLETGSRKFQVLDPLVPEPVAYAEALEKVRTLFREAAADSETGSSGQANQSVITTEEQKKQKAGAIIAHRRRFHGH